MNGTRAYIIYNISKTRQINNKKKTNVYDEMSNKKNDKFRNYNLVLRLCTINMCAHFLYVVCKWRLYIYKYKFS
jgi:hypothetical protein